MSSTLPAKAVQGLYAVRLAGDDHSQGSTLLDV